MNSASSLAIGWSQVDITPDEPVMLAGQFHARVSEGVRDPVTATALAIESPEAGQRAVLVSCDMVGITDDLRDAVRAHLHRDLPELDPLAVCFNATHTHTAPLSMIRPRYQEAEADALFYGVELPAMSPQRFVDFASRRIADTVIDAWQGRQAAGIAYGLEYAVVGHNRLISYRDGISKMYGATQVPAFSHVEGYEDHSLNILATFDASDTLTGLVLNIVCPSQVSEMDYRVSADFWHDVREELRTRHGAGLHILAQCSAAGDQTPRNLVEGKAEERMRRLAGRDARQEIAVRIADAVDRALPLIRTEIDPAPQFSHQAEVVDLPRRRISETDVEEARQASEGQQERFEAMLADLERDPQARQQPRWYKDITKAYRLTGRGAAVARRFEAQQRDPMMHVELHALRLGDVAIVTNPFELYVDYGTQIKARSPAMQTFVVQLAGPGTYIPTARSIAGKAYGAVPASTEIGVEGGEILVEWSLDTIGGMWSR